MKNVSGMISNHHIRKSVLDRRYKFDRLLEYKYIIGQNCALARVGLTTQNAVHLDLFSDVNESDHLSNGRITYYYKENIDYEHYVTPMETNSNLLLPTKERALVEYIQNEKWCDEGTLIEALKTWLFAFKDMDKLYEVADFFGLDRATLDYWIHEAETDDSILANQ